MSIGEDMVFPMNRSRQQMVLCRYSASTATKLSLNDTAHEISIPEHGWFIQRDGWFFVRFVISNSLEHTGQLAVHKICLRHRPIYLHRFEECKRVKHPAAGFHISQRA